MMTFDNDESRQILEEQIREHRRHLFVYQLEIAKEKVKHPGANADTPILIPTDTGANVTTFGKRMAVLYELAGDTKRALDYLINELENLYEPPTEESSRPQVVS